MTRECQLKTKTLNEATSNTAICLIAVIVVFGLYIKALRNQVKSAAASLLSMVASDTTKKGNCGDRPYFSVFTKKKNIFLLEKLVQLFCVSFQHYGASLSISPIMPKTQYFSQQQQQKKDLSVGVFATKDVVLSKWYKKEKNDRNCRYKKK